MSELTNKIDFAVIFTVNNANINGDPLNGNRPREDFDGRGIMSDVAIKRKIRNRLQDMGQKIFVQSDDRADDNAGSLKERADKCEVLKAEIDKKKNADRDIFAKEACRQWIDVRSFGQVFAFKGVEISVGVRGPVTVQQAVSVSPIDIVSLQITKSVNSEDKKDAKASDTMGMKHFVSFGTYVIKGSISCQLAKKTGFSEEDAALIKEALRTLFENDASSARPDGSCEVRKLIWWRHDCAYPAENSAKIHRSLHLALRDGIDTPHCYEDYIITLDPTECKPEIYDM